MRIAFLAVKNILRGGGIEKYTYELGSRLSDRGHQVTVYSMTHYGQTPDSVNGMRIISVHSLVKPYLQKMTASFSAALDILRRHSYDIVHLHSVASGAFGFLPRLKGIKTVLQMHGIEWHRSRWGNKGSIVLKLLEKTAVRQAIAITAVSKRQCAYFREQYGCYVEYIPTATAIPRRITPSNILKHGLVPGRYFLFASRLVQEKGAHTLIKAFKQTMTNMKLVIAGDCDGGEIYKHQLWDLARGDDRIVFTGYVEGQLLAELFSNAYVYVQPSTVEGLSIALLEAISYSRCCLVSDIPENLEPLDGTGYSFRVNSVEDLASKLQWLLENPCYVHSVETKAMEHVRSEYSWDFVTDRIEDFYHRTLSGDISVYIDAKSAVSH